MIISYYRMLYFYNPLLLFEYIHACGGKLRYFVFLNDKTVHSAIYTW